jgi:hypothetical protein
MTSWTEIDDGVESQGTETTVTNNTTAQDAPTQYFRLREF